METKLNLLSFTTQSSSYSELILALHNYLSEFFNKYNNLEFVETKFNQENGNYGTYISAFKVSNSQNFYFAIYTRYTSGGITTSLCFVKSNSLENITIIGGNTFLSFNVTFTTVQSGVFSITMQETKIYTVENNNVLLFITNNNNKCEGVFFDSDIITEEPVALYYNGSTQYIYCDSYTDNTIQIMFSNYTLNKPNTCIIQECVYCSDNIVGKMKNIKYIIPTGNIKTGIVDCVIDSAKYVRVGCFIIPYIE